MSEIHLIGNAHIDPVWLWQWQEGFAEVKATFRSALDRMKEFDDFIFTSACGAYYMWIEKSDPEMFEEIRARVKEGRWCLVGGWLIQPDCNLPSGESFARHALITQRYFLEKFGKKAITGYNVDSFGHNGSLPKILRASGMENYVFMRPDKNEKELPASLFNWRSADGSEVKTYRIPLRYGIEEKQFDELWQIAEMNEGTDLMAFYGVGNHGGGPTVSMLNKMHAELSESFVYSDPDKYFAAQDGKTLPVVEDDLQYHAKGCYSANSEIKKNNRRAESSLITAESLSVLSGALCGTEYPAADLRRAWCATLFNQFHDILGGCSIKEAYDDARHAHGEAMAIAERSINYAAQQISWNIDTVKDKISGSSVSEEDAERIGTPLVVFNPHGREVSGVVFMRAFFKLYESVTDNDGNPVPTQKIRDSKTNCCDDKYATAILAKVPPFGYKTYYFHKSAVDNSFENPFTVTDTSIENSKIRIAFNKATGEVSSLLDKESGKELLSSDTGIAIYDDTKHDTWAHGVPAYTDVIDIDINGTARVTELGPVRATVRTVHTFGNSKIIRDYSILPDGDTVTVNVKIDFREEYRVLKFTFPVNAENPQAKCGIPYGSITRTTNGDEHVFNEWVAITDGASGLTVTTDSKHSFDAKGSRLYLTVLRSCAYADHFGDRDEYTEVMEQGINKFSYTLSPYRSPAAAVETAAELISPLVAVPETFHKGKLNEEYSALDISADGVMVTAIKRSESGEGTVIRLYECNGKDTDVKLRLFGIELEAHIPHDSIRTYLVNNGTVTETDFLEL